jgi:hypothetical protein
MDLHPYDTLHHDITRYNNAVVRSGRTIIMLVVH